MQPVCLSLPQTPETSCYLVPSRFTPVSDGAGQSGHWKGQVRHSKVCQPQGKPFQSQLPPVGRGCPQRMKSGRAPHKGKSVGPEVSGTHHTAASRKPRPKLKKLDLLPSDVLIFDCKGEQCKGEISSGRHGVTVKVNSATSWQILYQQFPRKHGIVREIPGKVPHLKAVPGVKK